MLVITAVLKYENSRKYPRKFESLPDAHPAFGQNAGSIYMISCSKMPKRNYPLEAYG
jgi:hypothetical protein